MEAMRAFQEANKEYRRKKDQVQEEAKEEQERLPAKA